MDNQDETPEITLKNVSILRTGRLEEQADKMARDMKFFSVVYIVQSALLCLTIVGAIIGIPMIIYHIKLMESAESYRKFVKSNDFLHLSKAFENQRKFFFFYKVLLICLIIFFILYIGVMIYLFTQGFMAMPRNFA